MIMHSCQPRQSTPLPFLQPVGVVCASVVFALFGCAGNANRPASSAGIEAPQQVESDSARGSDFARLFVPGDTLRWPGIPPGSGFPKLPHALQGQDSQAAMLFAVIVDSSGRIEPGSRTLIASKGDPRLVKAWCDFLITVKLDWKAVTPRRMAALIPIIFFTTHVPEEELPQLQAKQRAFDPRQVAAILSAMTVPQRERWFADQQPCASFQAK
jgi:hypothetical protein